MLRPIALLLLTIIAAAYASAQTEVAPELLNRPPVSAPTSRVDVAPITVVRSLSQEIDDFGSGLIRGLMVGERVRSVALIAVQENRIIASKNFGCCVASDKKFSGGFQSGLFVGLAAMRLTEEGKLAPDRDNVAQMLTHQIDPSPLRELIRQASGQDARAYIQENILAPLDAANGAEPSEQIPRVMGRLMIALLNGGAFEGGQILQPQSVAEMEQTHYAVHPALPGWSYGLAEMRRNGWSAWQYDGEWQSSPKSQARLVVVPEAKLAYFVIIEGEAGARFWRTLDDALFDRILPPHAEQPSDTPSSPAPALRQANAVAGSYEASAEPLTAISSLKMMGQRLNVRANGDGSLVLAGAETAVLAPHAGGYWAAADGSLSAVERGGRLILTSGIFRPLQLWKRPAFYALFALVFGIGIAGAVFDDKRSGRRQLASARVTGLGAGLLVFLLLALLFWLISLPL